MSNVLELPTNPTVVVTVYGGNVRVAGNISCGVIVLDEDAEIMDPQGYPEVTVLASECDPAAVAAAEAALEKQEAARAG